MNGEVPFYENRRRRAGLIRRIGNLAGKLPTSTDPDFIAMHILATNGKSPVGEVAHLRAMMASQLEFVSPLSRAEARFIAEQAGIRVEFVNQSSYRDDITKAPENIRAAFVDVAAVAARNIE